MASFSFGAGNARKLLSIPLYAVGRAITVVVPRSPDEWVFGCGVGIADGALALWQVARQQSVKAVWLVASSREEQDAARHGIPTVRKHSIRGFWRTARARVVVVTHGFGDVNRYAVSGAYIVQLWHGIPLKRIGIDSPETTRVPSSIQRMPGAALLQVLLARAYRGATRRIDLLPASSDLVRGRLESAFSLPNAAVPVTGEPRVDVLSRGDAAGRRDRARGRLESLVGPIGGATVALYAPTWRDGEDDPAVPRDDDWHAITRALDALDAILLIRSHPLGAGEYSPPRASTRVRMLGAGIAADVTPLLPGLDILITDYSSLAFDASLVPLPTIFFAPDEEAYAARRGFYGRYRDVAGDVWAHDWHEVIDQLSAVVTDASESDRRRARATALSNRVHVFRDGHNTERVYRAIASATRRAPVSPLEEAR